MSVFLPLWYKNYRKVIKDFIVSNDAATAISRLNAMIAEHQANFPNVETERGYQYGELKVMEQARDHIQQIVIDDNNPNYYAVDHTNDTYTIKPHSEKVKEILDRTPKMNYAEI